MKIAKIINGAIVFSILLNQLLSGASVMAQPTRDPHTFGYVPAMELPDGAIPSPDSSGNFIIGPTHNPAPEMIVQPNVPQGTIYQFTMDSKDSKIYPGIAREPNTFGKEDPQDNAKLIVTTSHPAPYTRHIEVYVPKQYIPGTIAPFIVGTDGPDHSLFTALDHLVAERKVPVMIAISIGNGGGDAQGSERGLEYDAMSGVYAEFVEKEILPLVESKCNVKLTKDPDGRATMGGSSGGSCALIMAWYHPELYHRVLTYSGTYVNQQWPYDFLTPHGAWEFHEHLIPEGPAEPIRIWMEVGDHDLLNPNIMHDNMHDWVVANENMAKVLAGKGYHYQFIFARNAGHTDGNVKKQTLPEALEWLWKDYNAQTSPFLLALSKGDHTLAIVDPSTLKVLGKVPVGQDPHEVVASTDGKTAYVSIYGNGRLHTINVIDVGAQKRLEDIDTRPLFGPHGLVFINDKLWFTAEGSKAIGRYDPADKKIEWAMGTGQDRTHMIYVTSDTSTIFTTNVASGTVSVFQNMPSRGTQQQEHWQQLLIPVFKGCEGFDVSPDGAELWTASAQNGKIYIIDPDEKKLMATIDAKVNGANRLKFTPDGKLVFISSLNSDFLTVFDAKTHKLVKQLNIGSGAAGIQMQPDGTRAFVACSQGNYVVVIDIKSLNVTNKIDVGKNPDGLAWCIQH